MAVIHHTARISPTKLELLEAWVPTQAWGSEGLTQLGAYRWDDPAGAVGIEGHLLRAPDGRVLHVPLTYRAAPLDGPELITTMEHSVLGPRWIYDGCTDPVHAAALAAALLAGAPQALEELPGADGTSQVREPSVHVGVAGPSGATAPTVTAVATASDATSTRISADGLELVVAHVLPLAPPEGVPVLTGTWSDQPEPLALAWLG
jgi:hypothetical protein